MGVDEVVTEGEEALELKYPGFLDQLKTGKVIFRGHDREGRPLWYVQTTSFQQTNSSFSWTHVHLFAYLIPHDW